jgi:hypothetical protein
MWPMRPRRLGRYIVPLFALAAMALLAAPALAVRDSGTRTLVYGDFLSVEIPFESSSSISMDITYDVTVTSGPAVNVYFMDKASYEDFTSGSSSELSYYAAHSYLRTAHASDSFTWYEKGTYYIVVQHTGVGLEDNSVVVYEAEWEENAVGTSLCYILGAIFAVIVIGAITIAIINAKKPRPKEDRWTKRPTPAKPPPPTIVRRSPAPAPRAQASRTAPATDWVSAEQPYNVVPAQSAPAAPEEGALPEPVYAAPAAYRMDRPKPPTEGTPPRKGEAR